MKISKNVVVLLIALFGIFANRTEAQSIFNPADPVVTYNPASPPTQPAFGTIGKWVRTKRLNWNTDSFRCYIYNGRQFRLRFPKSYKPGVNDGKLYPLFIFYHGAGEGSTSIYDNEYQLFHGGQFFSQSVDNGTWDGYELAMQTTSSWGVAEYADLKDIIAYMIANNKVDPFHIVNNGLSAGGQGTWEMYINNPTLIAGLIPMSAVYSAYTASSFVNAVKFTPIWNLHGGQDGAPAPSTAAQVLAAMQAQGANYIDKEYITLGHDTWDSTWQEPNFWPFLKNVYMSNPWTLFGRTQFCNGDPINLTVGVVAGFDGYQWRMNGTVIPGATSNTINVTALGTYDARVLKGTIWSDWSHTPVVISIKPPTVTPNITISGVMSKVIPAPDGNTGVALKVPTGYTSYLWQKVGNNTTIGTDSVLRVTSPGQYIVKVTEQFGCSSSFSSPFTVIDANGPNKPDPASGLLVSTLSQTSLLLTWNQNPNPVNNETGFEIYQATKTGGPYKLITTTGADASKDTVKGLTQNTKYFYIVRAVNGTGASAVSNEANGTTTADTQAPTAPSNLTVTGTSPSSISISWGASTDNVGVTEYDIYINGVKSFVVPPTKTSYTVYSLVHKQTYALTVQAADEAGNHSASSNQVSAEPVASGLAYNYYNNLSATIKVIPNYTLLSPVFTGYVPNVTLTPATDQINFGFLWQGFITIPTTGKYTFETNSDDGSRLWLGTLGGTTSPYSFAGTPTVNNDGLHGGQNATSSQLTLTAGVYPIAIAFFQQGGGSGMSISWKTPASPNSFVAIPNSAFQETGAVNGVAPAAPTNILATATSYKNINLAWTDNSSNETGFEIYRATASGGTYAIVATTGPNVTSFSDSGVQAATTYNYKVQAVNQYGASGFDLASMGGIGYSYYQFSGSWTNMSLLNTLTPVSTGSLNNISLSPATATTNYAFKYQGTINIPTTGSYTFYTASDDGSDLYIGGYDSAHLVVKNDFAQGTTERSGVISLTKGKYPFYVTYFQAGGGFALTTSYQGPGISKALIPDSAFANKNATATTFGLPLVPAAATGLVATGASASSVNVSWTDNATNETSYQVWRSGNNDLNYVLLKTLPANSVSFTDNGLFANAVYYYKVAAVNVAGGATSNEDSALTLSVAPVITKLTDRSARYGVTTTIALKATEADGGALSYSVSTVPGPLSFVSLTDNGDGTGALVLNPAIGDQGVYNIMVVVKNAFGGADTTKFNLTVNNNYDPVMDTIVNYTLSEGDSVAINLHATDQNTTDNLVYAVSNIPNAYTLTNVSNGVATLSLHPGFAASGVYTAQVQVSDGNGGVATRTFVLTVNDKAPPSTKVSMRFKYQLTAPAPWNNITGLTTTGLKDDNNNTTGMGLQFQGSWFSTFNAGTTTNNNSGVYPDVVLSEYYFFGSYPSTFTGPSTVTASLTGLDVSQRYSISFMATSSWGVQSDNGTTTFTIGSQTIPIHVQANTQTLATFSGLKPASDGTITFTAATASGTPVGYLNSIVVTSIYDDGTVPAAPKSVSAVNVPGQGVQLNWQDVAYNETSYTVYRSLTAVGGYGVAGTAAANATGFLDSAISGNTQYYYRVQALNSYGGSDTTAAVSVTTSDRVPQIAAIGPVVLKNNQQATVNVTAADDASDHITLSVTNLPSFASFTDNGDGTGSITITPQAGNIGVYPVTVTATDNSDSSRSTSFTITVVDKNVSSTYIMFSGGPVGPAPWNSFISAPVAGASLGNLVDDAGTNTGMSVSLVNGFQWFVSTGMRPGNGTDIYPEAVVRNGFYESTTTVRTLTVGGLSGAKRYNFVFFNSHDDGFKCLTDFTIGSQTVSLNATYNTNKTVQINGVKPDGNGNVTISVVKEAGQDYAFLTTLIVQGYDSASAGLLSPSDLRVTGVSRTSVSLQWAARSTGETGFEVWRATSGSGSYSLVATLGAGSTTYTNTGLSQNTTYYYTVRAIQGTTVQSDYCSAVAGTTLVNAVYINFANGNQSPIPWNNTNTIPQQDFVFSNFYDELGVPTNTGMVVTRNFDGLYSAGVQTGNNSGIYPDAVMFDSYGLFPGDSASLRVTNLNESMVYNFTFFGSTTVWGDVNTSFTINGQTTLLNTSVNSTGTVTIYGVHPDGNGNVDINVAPGTLTSQFGLLGAMVMQGYSLPAGGSSAPALPMSAGVTPGVQGAVVPVSIVAAPQSLTTNEEPSAYPNPFTQSFTLVIPAEAGDNVEVIVYDASGKIVYGNKLSNMMQGDNTMVVNANSSFAKTGAYFAKIIYLNRGSAKEKIIKLLKQ
jgi:large repetitive protein